MLTAEKQHTVKGEVILMNWDKGKKCQTSNKSEMEKKCHLVSSAKQKACVKEKWNQLSNRQKPCHQNHLHAKLSVIQKEE